MQIAGAFVDRFGARQPLIVAAVCLAGGYMILLALFNQPQEVTASYGNSLPVLSVLVLCQFSIGVGSSIGCVGGTNAVAKGLPSHARATSLAATYAGVGLSAFLYSTTAHALFPSDSTVSFLGLLAGGCFVTIMIGQEMIHRTFDSLDYTTVAQDEEPSQAMVQIHPDHDHDELDKSSQDGNAEETREESIFELAPLDISGLELWRQVDFLILFTYGLIVLGTGVLYVIIARGWSES